MDEIQKIIKSIKFALSVLEPRGEEENIAFMTISREVKNLEQLERKEATDE